LTKQKRENKVQTINISDGAGDEDPDNYSEFVPTPQKQVHPKTYNFWMGRFVGQANSNAQTWDPQLVLKYPTIMDL